MSQSSELRLPEAIQDGLDYYRVDHIRPGSFLSAVIANDLRTAISHADENSMKYLRHIVSAVERLPESARGSREKIDNWVRRTHD